MTESPIAHSACQSEIACQNGQAVVPKNSSSSEPLPWPTIELMQGALRRTAELAGVWLPTADLDSCDWIPPQMSRTSSALQSLVQTTPLPEIPAASDTPLLPHSVPLEVNQTALALDNAPFFDMADRYKILRPENPESAERMADDLSLLVETGAINAFNQVTLHGNQVFTIDCC